MSSRNRKIRKKKKDSIDWKGFILQTVSGVIAGVIAGLIVKMFD